MIFYIRHATLKKKKSIISPFFCGQDFYFLFIWGHPLLYSAGLLGKKVFSFLSSNFLSKMWREVLGNQPN